MIDYFMYERSKKWQQSKTTKTLDFLSWMIKMSSTSLNLRGDAAARPHVNRDLLKTELLLWSLAFCRYISHISGHRKQSFWKTPARVNVFRNTIFIVYIWTGRNEVSSKCWHRHIHIMSLCSIVCKCKLGVSVIIWSYLSLNYDGMYVVLLNIKERDKNSCCLSKKILWRRSRFSASFIVLSVTKQPLQITDKQPVFY